MFQTILGPLICIILKTFKKIFFRRCPKKKVFSLYGEGGSGPYGHVRNLQVFFYAFSYHNIQFLHFFLVMPFFTCSLAIYLQKKNICLVAYRARGVGVLAFAKLLVCYGFARNGQILTDFDNFFLLHLIFKILFIYKSQQLKKKKVPEIFFFFFVARPLHPPPP